MNSDEISFFAEQNMLQREQKIFVNKIFFQSEQKIVQWNIKCSRMKIASNWAESREFKVTKSFHGHVKPYIVVLYGLALSCMAFYGLVCPFYGLLWPFYVLLCQNVKLIGLMSSFLAAIERNSFGLVFWICTTRTRTKYF